MAEPWTHLISVGYAVVEVRDGVEREAFHVLGHHVARQSLPETKRHLRLAVLEQLRRTNAGGESATKTITTLALILITAHQARLLVSYSSFSQALPPALMPFDLGVVAQAGDVTAGHRTLLVPLTG